MSEPVLTFANVLTLSRMGLVPFLVILIMQGRFGWALTVMIVAGLTDLFDGLAARLGQRTVLGAMLDPVADKILLSATFIALTWSSKLIAAIPQWVTVLTLSRDAIIVVAVVIVNLTVGKRVFRPSILGKASTLVQILTVGVVLLCNTIDRAPDELSYLFLLTAALTVASGVHYVYLAATNPPGPVAP
jgi:cardiolipin synthase (CMP-forming)